MAWESVRGAAKGRIKEKGAWEKDWEALSEKLHGNKSYNDATGEKNMAVRERNQGKWKFLMPQY